MPFLHELTKRSVAHRSMHWVTMKGFYPYYTHINRSVAISRWMLSIILVFASRGSDINCRNSAIVLKEPFPYWWVNRLLSRLILTLFIHTQKIYWGAGPPQYPTYTVLVGGVAQWEGRRSVAGGLSLIYEVVTHQPWGWRVTTSWAMRPLWVNQLDQLSVLPSVGRGISSISVFAVFVIHICHGYGSSW